MAIESTPGKGQWSYRLNEYNKREVLWRHNRANSRWRRYCVYATEEEATAELMRLTKGGKGHEGTGDVAASGS